MSDVRVDLRAERAVLGASFAAPAALALARGIVRPVDFAEHAHELAFATMCTMTDEREPVDLVTLERALRESGAWERVAKRLDINDLVFCGLSTRNVETHARIVADHAEARRFRDAATQLVRATNDPEATTAKIRECVGALLGDALRGQALRGPRSFLELSHDYWRIVEESADRVPGSIDGLPTGIEGLDLLLSGLHPHELVIVGARPRMGKSSLVMQMAVAAAQSGKGPALGFSLEMSSVNLYGRTLHSHARVDATKVRSARLTPDEFNCLLRETKRLCEVPVYLDDAIGMTIGDIAGKATAMKAQRGLSLVFIDYLQLVASEMQRGNRQLDVQEMSRGLKTLARTLDVPVVLLAQLNRDLEKRPDKRPILADLRESGSIEQDADVVIFLYRDVEYNRDTKDRDIAELIVAKQRNGPTDTIRVRWEGQFTRFAELDAAERDSDPPRFVPPSPRYMPDDVDDNVDPF